MRSTIFVVLAAFGFVALAQAGTWRLSSQRSSDSSETPNPKWSHRHSSIWPCDVADFPEAELLLHKVEKRLDRLDTSDERFTQRVVDYVSEQLRTCKQGNNSMDEHCVKRSIGYAMAFISNQQEKYQL